METALSPTEICCHVSGPGYLIISVLKSLLLRLPATKMSENARQQTQKKKTNSWSHNTLAFIHAMLMRWPCPASLSSGRDSVEWHNHRRAKSFSCHFGITHFGDWLWLDAWGCRDVSRSLPISFPACCYGGTILSNSLKDVWYILHKYMSLWIRHESLYFCIAIYIHIIL